MMRFAVVLLFVASAAAQPVSPPPPTPPPVSLTHQLEALTDEPATHTGFNFDRSMMQVAQNLLQSNGMDAGRAAAAITGVNVDTYHYQRPAFYDPEALNGLKHLYDSDGWKHLLEASGKGGNPSQPLGMITDLWLHFNGPNINAVTVLTRSSREMTVVQLTGSLRPLDLLHLSGHFGIPRVDPNAVMVPDPDRH
jgi:hypothetical protein